MPLLTFTARKDKTTPLNNRSTIWGIGLTVVYIMMGSAQAAQYYVNIRGDNAWSGRTSEGTFLPSGCEDDGDTTDCTDGPWRTIGYASNRTKEGDKVFVEAGVYNETVVIDNSGSSEKYRVFEGERGANGEWLTILDPGKKINRWVPAPEVAKGVYKISNTEIGFRPREITINDKRICFINPNRMDDGSGFVTLKNPDNQKTTPLDSAPAIGFWDGIEILGGSTVDNTYIRFENGANPTGKAIKAYKPIYTLGICNGASYNVIKDFLVVARNEGILLSENSHHNTIKNNRIVGGYNRVALYDGAHDNVIHSNEITMNYYGYSDLGPRSNGTEIKHAINQHIYLSFKYIVGYGSSRDAGIVLRNAGDRNQINDNHIFQGLVGITYDSSSDKISQGTLIHNNIIHNMASTGITISPGNSEAHLYKNSIYDCNINIRLHKMNEANHQKNSSYVYRNKLSLPKEVGYHFFFHWNDKGIAPKPPFLWVYNNSLSGGAYGFYNARNKNRQKLTNTFLLNNIGSTACFFYCQHNPSEFYSDNNALGGFDHNLVGTSCKINHAIWYGARNIFFSDYLWNPIYGSLEFYIPKNKREQIADAGIDLTHDFLIKDKKYKALVPVYQEPIFGKGPDLGADEYY